MYTNTDTDTHTHTHTHTHTIDRTSVSHSLMYTNTDTHTHTIDRTLSAIYGRLLHRHASTQDMQEPLA